MEPPAPSTTPLPVMTCGSPSRRYTRRAGLAIRPWFALPAVPSRSSPCPGPRRAAARAASRRCSSADDSASAARSAGRDRARGRGLFNYTDYERARCSCSAPRPDGRGEARALGVAPVRRPDGQPGRSAVYALFLRLRPWESRELDLQAGLVPPSSARSRAGATRSTTRCRACRSPTSTSPRSADDALPPRAEELVAQRGRGWLCGAIDRQHRRRTGACPSSKRRALGRGRRACAAGVRPFSLALAVTQGTLSHPEIEDEERRQAVLGTPRRPDARSQLRRPAARWRPALSSPTPRSRPCPVERTRTWRQQALGVDLAVVGGPLDPARRGRLQPLAHSRDRPHAHRRPARRRRRVPRSALQAAAGPIPRRPRRAPAEMASSPTSLGPREWDAHVTRFELGAGWSPARRRAAEGLLAAQQPRRRPRDRERPRGGPGAAVVLSAAIVALALVAGWRRPRSSPRPRRSGPRARRRAAQRASSPERPDVAELGMPGPREAVDPQAQRRVPRDRPAARVRAAAARGRLRCSTSATRHSCLRWSRSRPAAPSRFPNSDRVTKRVLALKAAPLRPRPLSPRGQSRSVVFDKPGVVRVFWRDPLRT